MAFRGAETQRVQEGALAIAKPSSPLVNMHLVASVSAGKTTLAAPGPSTRLKQLQPVPMNWNKYDVIVPKVPVLLEE